MHMTSIALVLADGSGTIFENTDRSSERAPLFVGYVEFLLNKEKSQKLKLDVAVWVKQKANSDEKFYSLSIGGINASLFKESEKVGEGPDYAGSFGFNHEMRIAGWKKLGVNGAKDYISLAISPRVKNASQAAPQQNATPTSPHEQPPVNAQAPGPVDTGDPAFQF
jgi:hypothetical protein